MRSTTPKTSELFNGDNNNYEVAEYKLLITPPNDLSHFFLEKHNQGCDHLEVLDCMTGAGKTEKFLEYVMDNRMDKDFKIVYAASTVQELLEVILRLRRKMISNGQRVDNVKNYLTAKGRLSFNFNGSKKCDLSKVKELLDSTEWTAIEKKFIKSLNCQTVKYASECKVIFTTHKTLAIRAEFFSDYTVFIDEIPSFAYNLTYTRKDAGALTAWHCDIINISGEAYIDPDMVSYAIHSGLVKIDDFGEGAVLYHINPYHPFKRCIIMTAYANSTGLGVLKRMGKAIEIVTTVESAIRYAEACNNLDLDVCKNQGVTNKDTKKIQAELLAMVNDPSKAFTISTVSQEMGSISVSSIRTNKVGINSLANLNECLVATQLNLSSFDKSKYVEVFGEDEALEIERHLAGSKILQSVFRGSIRRGEPMRIIACSSECVVRIVSVLYKYSDNKGV